MFFKVDKITLRVKVSLVWSLYPGSSYIIYFACHSKPILFVLVRIRRQPASAVSVSDSFNTLIQRTEQNKKNVYFTSLFRKETLFPYSMTGGFRPKKDTLFKTLDCEIVPGGYSWEFLVGMCRPDLQILTLFQTKMSLSIPTLRPTWRWSQNETT